MICCKNSNFRAKLNKTLHNRVFSLFSAFFNANCAHRWAISSSRRTATGQTAQTRLFRAKTAQFRVFSLFSAFFAANCAHRWAIPSSRRTAAGRTARMRHFRAKAAQFCIFSYFPAHYADSPVQNVLFRTFYRSTGRHQFLRIID